MKWITGVVKFRNILIHECKLVPSSKTVEKVVEDVLREIQCLSTLNGTNSVIYTDNGSASTVQLSSNRVWASNDHTTNECWASG
jgi:hypothetical protein